MLPTIAITAKTLTTVMATVTTTAMATIDCRSAGAAANVGVPKVARLRPT